ncbi:Calcineurin-like metallo-phosphoesterase superfamily protein [Perilla frutescens var. hirtella]|uniref:Calcineurin-like metallo-phosphoesterase superfamily protein n=1 Tax=Perilla frutescens var. hirtella TaxID=608512 RepID=A0AAD4P001_PERFH|nr:Calcineurin-like metallo-phosphoesterase superfamily protein [Perilla frutescens var. hirtella]
MDRTSLHIAPKSLALEVVQFYTDLYMRRAFLSSVLPFNPDIILFLGDYFDGGDRLSDDEWQESLGRFRHIFNLNMIQKNSNIKVYYLSGNHDIGYSAFNSRKPEIIKRHEREFGARNFKVRIGEVDFIAIDAQTLDGHQRGDLTSSTWGFIKNTSKEISSTPRVLLTHIPLYRPDWTPCGSHRSSPIINQVNMLRSYHVDYALFFRYQNYVTKTSTNVLLDLIKPALVLSGHDHDQCTVTHTYNQGRATEHTLGTVSWQQGNLYPSFMLLSAKNSTVSDGKARDDDVYTDLCFLPMQTHIYIWYLSLFAMTLVIILLWPANEVRISRKLGNLMVPIRSVFKSLSNVVKEKNEDENCEYEEMWDAEGSMHLIKKTKKVSSTTVLNEGSSVERGNVVMRSKARKQTGLDVDGSSEDVSIHIGSARAQKSKARMMVRRLLRALRALMVIAAFNVPLYVLLVFKDWIDK